MPVSKTTPRTRKKPAPTPATKKSLQSKIVPAEGASEMPAQKIPETSVTPVVAQKSLSKELPSTESAPEASLSPNPSAPSVQTNPTPTHFSNTGSALFQPSTKKIGEEIIRAEEVIKAFDIGTQMVLVLKGVTFSVTRGDFMVLFGASGCGKSTLLHILLGLEAPTKGKIIFLGEDIYDGRSEDDRAQFRKHHVGMVYQQSNWVKSLSVLENVAFPLMLLGEDKTASLEKAYETLKIMKMENWAHYHPMELSGGQQQRVSVARAIITDPEVLVADEPTGNLDYEAGQNLMYLLNDLNNAGKTIIMVTHDLEYIRYSKTALNMKDGRIEGVYREQDKANLEAKLTYKKADFSALDKQ